jgi:hypothetical protein
MQSESMRITCSYVTDVKCTVQRDGPGFIKGRGVEIFSRFLPPPILLEPFKDSAPSRTAVGY